MSDIVREPPWIQCPPSEGNGWEGRWATRLRLRLQRTNRRSPAACFYLRFCVKFHQSASWDWNRPQNALSPQSLCVLFSGGGNLFIAPLECCSAVFCQLRLCSATETNKDLDKEIKKGRVATFDPASGLYRWTLPVIKAVLTFDLQYRWSKELWFKAA